MHPQDWSFSLFDQKAKSNAVFLFQDLIPLFALIIDYSYLGLTVSRGTFLASLSLGIQSALELSS